MKSTQSIYTFTTDRRFNVIDEAGRIICFSIKGRLLSLLPSADSQAHINLAQTMCTWLCKIHTNNLAHHKHWYRASLVNCKAHKRDSSWAELIVCQSLLAGCTTERWLKEVYEGFVPGGCGIMMSHLHVLILPLLMNVSVVHRNGADESKSIWFKHIQAKILFIMLF